MNANQLAAALYKELGLLNPPREEKRQVSIAVSRANYGKESAVIIEFQGSPPRCTIFMTLGSLSERDLMVCGKAFRYGKKKDRLCSMVESFLAESFEMLRDEMAATSKEIQ